MKKARIEKLSDLEKLQPHKTAIGVNGNYAVFLGIVNGRSLFILDGGGSIPRTYEVPLKEIAIKDGQIIHHFPKTTNYQDIYPSHSKYRAYCKLIERARA